MKKITLVSLLIASFLFCYPQTQKAKNLVNEGVELHDNGKYEDALKKYDAAIAEDDTYFNAHYEKAMTLYVMKKLEECIDLSKTIIKKFPDEPLLKGVYVHYGSSLDDLGKSSAALKVYDEGLKKFPGFYMLHFNKAITYALMNETEKAYTNFKAALVDNPFHASSYFRVADMLKTSNRIPAMLAFVMHLILETKRSERSEYSFTSLKELIYGNVKKTGDNSITITMDESMLDSKKLKKEEDNFRMQDMLFVMSSALDKDSVMSSIAKTDIEKFDLKLQLLINSLSDEKDKKGFFSERYVPFFKSLKENDYTMIVSRLVFKTTNDEANAAWLKVNTDKTDAFYDWLKAYKWPEN
jgi:hypothetical protein